MPHVTYEPEITGLVVVDPYNDFISEGGKVWDRLSHVATANQCVPHMLQVVNGAREKGLPVFYALHHRYRGFANTDLDLQLKKHDIHKIIVIGLIATTCIDSTVCFAAELGYEVTVVRDATASFSDQDMHAALDVTIPNYASAIVTTSELLDSMAPTGAHVSTR